jgi:uncharacterized damage-inducible protein DinB
MTEIERLVDLMRRIHNGDPWHGSSTLDLLEGVTAKQAAAKPVPGAHAIWEIVGHLIGYHVEVRRRLLEGNPREPDEGDWPPPVKDTSDGAWKKTIDRFGRSYEDLLKTVSELPASRLEENMGSRDRALGTGVPIYVLVHGLMHHDVYHAGQIGLLKRALVGRG